MSETTDGMNAIEKYLHRHPFPWKRSKDRKEEIIDAKGNFVADAGYLATAIIEHEAHHALKSRLDHATEQFERDIERDNPEYQP